MKKFYIMERQNPQTGVYYVAMGQLSKAEAKKHEKPLYGYNIMHSFGTEEEYSAEIFALKTAGERVV